MIRARHTAFHVWFFEWYSRFMIHKDFNPVRVISDLEVKEKPMLIMGNHFSWWDGFFVNYLNQKVFRKKFHVMMLEEQLKNRMFLNKTGAFSINPGSRSMVTSIQYAADILKKTENLLLMYPQGKIYSMHNQPLLFEKGWMKILEKVGNDFQLVFYAALVDYFSNRKPGLNLYLDEHELSPNETVDTLQEAYNTFYQNAIARQTET